VFTVADESLADNFAISTTQIGCFCTCGDFGPALQGTSCESFFLSNLIDDIGDDDSDYFVHGWDGGGGANYLTSTSTLPLCPSTVKFDFTYAHIMDLGALDRTMELQVFDPVTDTVLFAMPVPSATLFPTGGTISATVLGEEIVLSDPVSFNSCIADAKLRFAWNIPEACTGPAQLVLDNVFVTPIPAGVRKIESETDTIETIIALISRISPLAFPCYIHARVPVEEAPKEIRIS
jgi:hypothetical protein